MNMAISETRYVAARGARVLAALCLGTTMTFCATAADALPARAYVASKGDGTLRVIEGKAEVEPPIALSDHAINLTDVATSPDGRRVYVASPDEDRVYVVDALTQTPAVVEDGDNQLDTPTYLAATDFGAFVANEANHTVSRISHGADGISRVEVTTSPDLLPQGGKFQMVAITHEPADCCVYVGYANRDKSRLFVFDYALTKRDDVFPLPDEPRALGTHPIAPVIYVTFSKPDAFLIWDWAQKASVPFINDLDGRAPQHVDVTPNGLRLLMTTRFKGDAIRVYSLDSGVPTQCIDARLAGHLVDQNADGVASSGDG